MRISGSVPRRGVTVLELVIVLVLLAVIGATVALDGARAVTVRSAGDRHWEALRRAAILQRHDTSVAMVTDRGVLLVTATPAGELVIDSAVSPAAVEARSRE